MNPIEVRRAVRALLRETSRLEDAAAARQLAILKATRSDLVRLLVDADPERFRTFQRTELLGAIDREIARSQSRSVEEASSAATTAYDYGRRTVDDSLSAIGMGASFGDMSAELVDAVADVVSDQVRSVWSELGTTLKAEVRRAALGVVDPVESMVAIQRVIRDPKTFGSSEVRAEAIIRTEVNRAYGVAGDERLRQSNRRLDGKLRKYWLSAGGSRARASHIRAGADYAPNGAIGPIPVDEPFVVGGASLMFPLDPRGPAREVVNCRCRSVPYVADL